MNIGRINKQNELQNLKKTSQKKSKKAEGADAPKDQISIKGKPEEKEITFLTYLDGSNNLEDLIMQNLKDMERVGSTDNVNVVAQLSRFQVPALTKNFFGETLKQVVNNEKFGEVLNDVTGNPDGVKEFQEMFKNPRFSGYMADSVLSGSPPLMQGMTQMVEGLAGNMLADENMGEMFTTVAFQLAQSMIENKKDEVAGATLMAGKSKTTAMDMLSKHMLNGIAKFVNENMKEGKVLYVDRPYTGGSVMKSADKAFVPDNEPGWIGARRYYVTKGEDESVINSKVVKDMEFVNMGEPATLKDFVVWGMKNFPAKKYVLLASDHGAGILGGFEDRHQMMSLPQIGEALAEAEKETGKKPDVLIFDACLMAQAEVGYEMKDRADVMVASEEVVGGIGMPYVPMMKGMNKLAEEGKVTADNIAKMMIDECAETSEESTTTFSAIRLGQMENMKKSLDGLADAFVKTKVPKEDIKFLLHNTTSFSQGSSSAPYRDFKDVGHFADNILKFKYLTNGIVIKAAEEVKKALADAVIAEEHIQGDEDYSQVQGLSVYAPKSDKYVSKGVYKDYKETAMSKDGTWDEFIEDLTGVKGKFEEKEGEEKVGKPEFRELPQRS